MRNEKPMYSPEMMEVLWTYAKSPDLTTRCSVFNNTARVRSVPTEILTYLANDEVWYVRMLVAMNKRTPIELLKHLVVDEHPTVRMGVFQNPKCTDEIIVFSRAYRKYRQLIR